MARNRAAVLAVAVVLLAGCAGGSHVEHGTAVAGPSVDVPEGEPQPDADAGRLTVTWPTPTSVSRISRPGLGAPVAATVQFADGSAVPVFSDPDGAVRTDFPARTVESLVIDVSSVDGDQDAAVTGWQVTGPVPVPSSADVAPSSIADPAVTSPSPRASGSDGTNGTGPVPASVDDGSGATESVPGATGALRDASTSASSATDQAWAVADGSIASGSAGASWTASAADPAPWVRLTWAAPRRISSAMILGLVQDVRDPARLTEAPLRGELVFDDGSTVAVDGISGDPAEATVVAFPARATTSLQLRLSRTKPAASVGLQELAVFDEGVTPPRWTQPAGPTYSVTPAAASCPAAPALPPTDEPLQLVCPAVGSNVSGATTLVVQAPGSTGRTVELRAWVPTSASAGSVQVVATARVGPDGSARLSFSATPLGRGPLGLQVRLIDGSARARTLSVQVVNAGGVELDSSGHAPAGTTLQWSEDFTSSVSVTRTGHGAVYSALKNEYWGGSEFGDAAFVDPAAGRGTLATVGSDWLRVRAQPMAGADPNGWGRRYDSGMLSSMRQGGSGFAAQYGYFEARMLAPGGTGTWPAFWMMDTGGATDGSRPAAEVDAVELYGHSTLGSCHTVHNWRGGGPTDRASCPDPNGFSDWSLTWHTYGVQIRPGGADFYVDGQLVARSNGLENTSRPFFFMVNLALGGGYPVDLDPTSGVADLYVDWIRVST